MVLVFVAATDCLVDNDIFEEKYHKVKVVRQQKVERLHKQEDKRLSLGAGLLLKHALQAAGGDYETAEFFRDKYGKPHVKDQPFAFTLSHSGDRVMCAIAEFEHGDKGREREAKLGCDVQKILKYNDKVSQRSLTQTEYEHVMSISDEDEKAREFYRIWAMKESYVKAVGRGLGMSLNKVDVLSDDAIRSKYIFRNFAPDNGYSYCVCADAWENISEIQFVSLDADI